MRLLQILVGALAGASIATVLVWGALYVYGSVVLKGQGSLFDTNPDAANTFFTAWFVLLLVLAVVGGYLVARRKK